MYLENLKRLQIEQVELVTFGKSRSILRKTIFLEDLAQ